MKKTILILVASFIVIFSGCKTAPSEKPKTPYDRPLPPGQSALRKITNPDEIPDFSMACLDLAGLETAIGHSINYLQKPSSQQFYPIGDITHSRALESLKAFSEMLDSGMAGAQLNQAIRQKFDVYISIGCDDLGTVLFTGYYTPIFPGSFTRSGRFQYPLYKQPNDLVKGPGRLDPRPTHA